MFCSLIQAALTEFFFFFFFLFFQGHTMTVVMADGHYIEPFEVANLDIYSGQSYCVLFNANRNPTRNYWAAINVRGRVPATPTGLAIVQYLPNSANLLPPSPAPVSPAWNDFAASMAQARKYVAKTGYTYRTIQEFSARFKFL
jgi:L-ascorbate oxidase